MPIPDDLTVDELAWIQGSDKLFQIFVEDTRLEELGLLEPGQPTRIADIVHRRRMRSEFTAAERRQIRFMLGLRGKHADPR